MDTNELEKRIIEIEDAMQGADFWTDKNHAQALIRDLAELRAKKEGINAYDRGSAIMSILSGAGGDDAEDFSRMLYDMYMKYFSKHGFSAIILSENKNDQNGYRNISIEITGKNAYGTFKHESGVHRLVRVSPFNAKGKRNTSFSMVEVIPKIPKGEMAELRDADLRVELSKAGGPGGQNVNKRETAVRIVHIPTGFAVAVSTERSQEQNKERALELLKGKLWKKAEDEHKSLSESMQISKTTDIEWGNQIRNYVLHPYKLVKDLRTGIETASVDKVLAGELDMFIEAEKGL
jgi:peptide chain release factor 2